MRTSVIARHNLSQVTLIFLVISIFVFVAGAVYVAVGILPGKSLFMLLGLIVIMTILTATLTWQPKVALPLLIVSVFFSPDIIVAHVGRKINLRVEDAIIVALILGLIIRYAAARERLSIRTPLDKPIMAYCLVALVSTLLSIYLGNQSIPVGVSFFVKWIEYFVLFYLLRYCLEGKKEIKIAIYIVFLCIFIHSVYNGYMRLTEPEIMTQRAYTLIPQEEDRSTEYAAVINLMLPIVLAIAIETQSFQYIIAAGIISPLAIFTLLDTLHRTSFIGTAVALLFLVLYRYRILLPLLAGIIFYVSTHLPARIMYSINFLWWEISKYPFPGGSLPARVEGLKEAIGNFTYRPLLGRGLGTYGLSSRVSHNQYALFLMETGLLGLAFFLWFIFSAIKLALQGIKVTTDSLHRAFYVGYLAGLIGWLVAVLSAPNFSCIRTMESFMIMTSILVACTTVDEVNA